MLTQIGVRQDAVVQSYSMDQMIDAEVAHTLEHIISKIASKDHMSAKAGSLILIALLNWMSKKFTAVSPHFTIGFSCSLLQNL